MLAFIVAASNRMPPGNHDRTSGYTLEVTHRAQEKEGNCAMLGFAFHDGSLFKRIRHAPCIWALHASMAPQCMHTYARTVYGCGHQTDFLGAPECRPQGLLAGAEVAVLLGGALRDTRPLLLGWAAPGLIHKVDIQLLDVPAIAWQRRGSTARQRSSSRVKGLDLHCTGERATGLAVNLPRSATGCTEPVSSMQTTRPAAQHWYPTLV